MSENRRGRWIVAGAAAVALSATGATPASAAEPLTRFHRQAFAWHGCRLGPADEVGAALDQLGVQCGDVRVPLDYRRPGGRTLTVVIYRVRATDPARRRGTLMINPGGPGVPGLEQVLLGEFMPEVAGLYDLVSMDPRFVGRSGALSCRWDTNTFLRSAGPDRRSFDDGVRLAADLAAGCDLPGQRDLLPYASTRNTARDMDIIRAVLGERKLSYFGVSYGTYLGAVYLQLFGPRADRFVLDSAVDPGSYGPGLLRAAGPAIAAALRHWAGFAAAHDAQFHLGATADAVLSTIDSLREPMAVGGFHIDEHTLPYLLFTHLYDDSETSYLELAADVRTLQDASRGEAVEPGAELQRFLSELFTGSGPATDRAGTPILCADRAVPADPETYYADIQAHRVREPLFGPLTRNITPCAFWPSTPVERPTTIRNNSPVLMVGADGDPAAPLPGQQVMHRALAGSRMVTLRGAYRHGVFLAAGNGCIDAAVTGYLVDGRLPARDGTCEVVM